MKKYTYGYSIHRQDQSFSEDNLSFKEALNKLHEASKKIECLTKDEAKHLQASYGNTIRLTLDRYSDYDEDGDYYNTIESLEHYNITYTYSKSEWRYIKKWK